MRLVIAAIIIVWAAHAAAVEPDAPENLISKDDAFAITLLNAVQAKAKIKVGQRRIYEGLFEFYFQHRGTLVWIENGAFTRKATELRAAIANAAAFGLSPSDYAPPGEDALRNGPPEYPNDPIANAEVEMSVAAVLYATHAQSGRFAPQEVDEDFDPSPDVPSPSSILLAVMKEEHSVKTLLESYHPQHPQFKAILKELAKSSPGQNAPAALPIYGPALRLGMTHPEVAILRARLKEPAAEGVSVDYFDEALSKRVKALQKENDWRDDGVVNVLVRRALQIPPPPSRKVLIANLERWRWLPRDLGETHIRINLPEYLVRVVRNGAVTFQERIVIGSAGNKTPIFSNKMRTVVINPYWNVPASIATNEIIPLVQDNPGYLTRMGMEAMVNGYGGKPVPPSKIDWSRTDASQIMLRQLPGGGNALGELKFLFPNRHNVYLHDTPTKYLFNETARPFSHGCMRVRNPRKLAEAVLGWTPEKVRDAIVKGGPNQEVPVEPRIPVHVMYFTVWIDDDGAIQTFRDVYNHDQKVSDAINGQMVAIAPGVVRQAKY